MELLKLNSSRTMFDVPNRMRLKLIQRIAYGHKTSLFLSLIKSEDERRNHRGSTFGIKRNDQN